MVSKELHPVLKKVRFERTLCIIKPDGVMRGLVGEIIKRFERTGLKVVALKMMVADKKRAGIHYSITDEALLMRIGDNTHSGFATLDGLTVEEVFGTADKMELGRGLVGELVNFLCSGPSIFMVVEGVQAITMVRKLVGSTMPVEASVGTIRGDYSVDSSLVANSQGRAIHNLIHASGNKEEAESEIKLWLDPSEIHNYKMSSEAAMFEKYY